MLVDGSNTMLPNIHPQLLLLTQLQPGRMGVGWGALFGLWLGELVAAVMVVLTVASVWWWHCCLGVG